MSGITIQNLSKAFFGVSVLTNLSLQIERGKILGLVGENGAGKSTLLNIMGGHLQADSGDVLLDGQLYQPRSSRAALASGVGLVHQELNLFPNLTIAENLFLTTAPTAWGLIRRRATLAAAKGLLDRIGLAVAPSMRVANLSAGQQQLVELARVLAVDSTIVLLDEPTTSLSDRESISFFRLVKELANEGRAIVLVTHAIRDVLTHCDRVAILRDGELVEHAAAEQLDLQGVIQRMIGRPVSQLFPTGKVRSQNPPGPMLLEVQQVNQRQTVRNVSFALQAGELLGVFGLMGAGRSELARIMMGLDPCDSGEIKLDGKTLSGGPRARIAAGLGMVTESRRSDGILAESSVAENLSLVALRKFASHVLGLLASTRLASAVDSMRRLVHLQNQVANRQAMKTLSGGNQQKIVVGKWFLNDSRVLILDEPTRGIDVGAKFELYQLIHRYVDSGKGVLVISSDIEELIGLCDRVLVMSLGRVTGEFRREEFDREQMMKAAFSQHSGQPATEAAA